MGLIKILLIANVPKTTLHKALNQLQPGNKPF